MVDSFYGSGKAVSANPSSFVCVCRQNPGLRVILTMSRVRRKVSFAGIWHTHPGTTFLASFDSAMLMKPISEQCIGWHGENRFIKFVLEKFSRKCELWGGGANQLEISPEGPRAMVLDPLCGETISIFSTLLKSSWAGRLFQRFRALLIIQRTGVWFPHPQGSPQAHIIPIPGDLTPSSGLFGHCMTMVHGHTFLHIKWEQTKSQIFWLKFF